MHLSRRIGSHFGWKCLGAGLYVAGFPLYLLVQRLGEGRSTAVPFTLLERAVPVWPAMIVIYLGQLVVIGLPFFLLTSRSQWWRAALGLTACCAVVLLCHAIWPTHVLRPVATDPLLGWLHRVDGRGSAVPSLHAACAVYAAMLMQSLDDVPCGLLVFGWLWLAAVLLSCVSLRQHGWIDLAAGALIAVPIFLLSNRRPAEATA